METADPEKVVFVASTYKCSFCGAVITSDEKTCKNCGAENPNYTEDSPRKIFNPRTIEELKEYCAERGMPLYRMRFFVGEDFQEARAFGIYKAGENRFVVYKNKADGTRAVRYDGPDEAFAVKELFDKLLSECHNRGIYPDGPVQRSSGSAGNTQRKKNAFLRHPVLFVILGIAAIILSIVSVNKISEAIRVQAATNRQVEAFRENPNSFDSKQFGNKWYTYDVSSETIVVTDTSNNHLNDGYYEAVETGGSKSAFYRRDETDWYKYIPTKQDWVRATWPDFSSLNYNLFYRGTAWQSTWNVHEFESFPIQEGYYLHGEEYYYRWNGNNEYWYCYEAETNDWISSDCPVKLGVPVNELHSQNGEDLPEGIRRFDKSSPYARKKDLAGYYREGGTYYYRAHVTVRKKNNSSNNILSFYSYYNTTTEKYWYQYRLIEAESVSGQESPDAAGGKEWYRMSDGPRSTSLVYLGETYGENWQQDFGISDFKKTASGMESLNIDGYVKQGENLYYHYKDKWYKTGSDSDSWTSSDSPAADGYVEVYLGESFEDDIRDDWDEDWTATDFKESTTWKSIVAAEKAEEARIEAEREAERQKREEERKEREKRNSWSSHDYDSWDSNDTDWDSDW